MLLQGETSVGKTSLINWLAQASGNVCLRINNHDHTDLQEYVGCYAADDTGKLVFQEGSFFAANLFEALLKKLSTKFSNFSVNMTNICFFQEY